MKTQLTKPARHKARYTEEYKQEALELWRNSGRSAAKVAAEPRNSSPTALPTSAEVRLVGFCRSRGLLQKLETDFAVLEFQIGGERAFSFGDEAVEEIGLSRGKNSSPDSRTLQ